MRGGRLINRISIIIANRNHGRFLKDCFDSILEQTYRHLDVVVFDDGSTDDSPEIIGSFQQKYPGRVRGILGKRNLGVARARHEAIVQAEGEYISTLDSDDFYVDSRKIENEMALVLTHRERGKEAIAFSNIVLVDEGRRVIGPQWRSDQIREGMILDNILTRMWMIPRDFTMAKAAYFRVGGYDFRIPIYEDWDLKIRLAAAYEYYYTGFDGTAYRRHGSGLSAAEPDKHIQWLEFIFKKNIELIAPRDRRRIAAEFRCYLDSLKQKFRV